MAPIANADGSDNNFLAMLSAAGIPAHDGIPSVISYGQKVCDALNGGESPSSIANTLAEHAYGDDPLHPLGQYQRQWWRSSGCRRRHTAPATMAVLRYHGGYRVVLTGLDEPLPPPQLSQVPDMAHMTPPVVVAKPKQNPPPEEAPAAT